MNEVKTNMKEFEELLLQTVKSDSDTFIWDMVGPEIIKVPIRIKSFNSYKKQISFEVDSRAKNYMKNLISSNGLLKMFMPNVQFIFVAPVFKYSGNSLIVGYPSASKRHDRRKSKRFEPLVPISCKLGTLSKECFDISLGGFSLIVNKMEYNKASMEIGQVFDCKVGFPLEKVNITGQIVNVKDIKPFELDRFPYGAKKISFQVGGTDGEYHKNVENIGKGIQKLINDLV